LLAVSAFLSPDRIPYELLVAGASVLGEPLSTVLAGSTEDLRPLNRLLAPLGRYSLIRRDRATQSYDIHRLVQAVIRAEMDDGTRRAYAEHAVRAVDAAFPELEFSNWPECDRLLPHALVCADWIEADGMQHDEAARLLNEAGCYLSERAQYAAAEPLYRRALAIREKALGPEHPGTAEASTTWRHSTTDRSVRGGRAAVSPRPGHPRDALGPEHPIRPEASTAWRVSTPARVSTPRPSPCLARPATMRRRWARAPPYRPKPQRSGGPLRPPGSVRGGRAPVSPRPGHHGEGIGSRAPPYSR
jgi:hypothetical protein